MVSWRTCLVETCRYNPRKSDSKRRVLHIPESKATEWLRILNIQNKPKKKLYICESHFAQECITGNIRFTNDAVPSLNLGISQTEKMEDSIEDMKSFSNAPEYIDELESDIPDGFKMEAFVPLLKERVYLKNSFVRQYVISCISILNAETEINVGLYFIDIIDGLFTMLEDNTQEIQRICESTLIKFLKFICNDDSSSISHMEDTMNTLIIHAQSPHQRIKFIALTWIREFVQIFGSNVLPYASGIFTAILPYLECEENSMANVKECAVSINKSMMKLVASEKHKIQNIEEMKSIITILSRYLNHNSEQTKIAVLEWIYHLLIHFPNEMSIYLNELSNNLLDILSDNSDDVVLKCILILAEIIKSQHSKETTDFNKAHYRKFLLSLIKLFNEDKSFLDNRASLIIRQLCVLLNAEYIYLTFSEIIAEEVTNLKFASLIVRLLNSILLTSSELFELRSMLRDISKDKSAKLFKCLYLSWCHCPVSTLSLCLLAQSYQHVSDLVVLFADVEITLELLSEIDKLVQLIETPIFASLRLTLVSKANNCADAQHLAHALFGILMLLPQTEAFHMLKHRLQCVPNYWGQQPVNEKQSLQCKSNIDFVELMLHFKKIQKAHRDQRSQQRKRSFLVNEQ